MQLKKYRKLVCNSTNRLVVSGQCSVEVEV